MNLSLNVVGFASMVKRVGHQLSTASVTQKAVDLTDTQEKTQKLETDAYRIVVRTFSMRPLRMKLA